jgi:hypothetical protein
VLWESLTSTRDVYRQLGEQYKVPSAGKIVELSDEALTAALYADPSSFVKMMRVLVDFELVVGEELSGQVSLEVLQKYMERVKSLGLALNGILEDPIEPAITWAEAGAVSEMQVQAMCVHSRSHDAINMIKPPEGYQYSEFIRCSSNYSRFLQ